MWFWLILLNLSPILSSARSSQSLEIKGTVDFNPALIRSQPGGKLIIPNSNTEYFFVTVEEFRETHERSPSSILIKNKKNFQERIKKVIIQAR